MGNQETNHPKVGDKIAVVPIRSIEHIKSIRKLLANNKRDLLLFNLGIANGLRGGDLLELKVKQVLHVKEGDTVPIIEQKTKKPNICAFNKTSWKSLQSYLKTANLTENDYLFSSNKKSGRKDTKTNLTVSTLNALVKKWTGAINLPGNYGSHSLRKTWGFIQRTEFGVSFEIICKRFNHANPTVTMRYLGIQDKEVYKALLNDF